MTTVMLSFILLVSLLIASGLILCATSDADSPAREVKATLHLGTNFPDEPSIGRTLLKDRAVGIHLGITHSGVAVCRTPCPPPPIYSRFNPTAVHPFNSSVYEMVVNEHGRSTTPSCVSFTDSGGVLIGESAKNQAPAHPERTVCGIVSLLGKRFDDPDVQSYIKTLPYKVVNRENKPRVEVKFKNGETKLFSPEQICAFILRKMKDIAEAYMRKRIESVVLIHHHSLLDKANRRIVESSIREAGKMVGLLVDIVDTSRIAPVTCEFGDKRVLVYNLGGRAFDVSLQVNDDGVFEVVASRGDARLGGQALDMRVVDYFVNLIKSKYNRDISEDMTALRKLKIESEKAKIVLSTRDRVIVRIESLADGIALFEEPLTRETFEELNMDLFTKTINLVRDVINGGSEITNSCHLDSLLLVGGNARIPKIQQMLKEKLGIEPRQDFKPDETLPFLATYLAAGIRVRNLDSESYNIFVMPYAEKLMAGDLPSYWFRIINPYTNYGQIASVTMDVFEGETPWTKYRRSLGRFEIHYPPNTRGPVLLAVKMEVDVNADVRIGKNGGGCKRRCAHQITARRIIKHYIH